MRSGARFSAAILGFDEGEQRLLKGIFALSENRTPTFYAYVFSRETAADIVLVNADSPRALNGWLVYQRLHGAKSAVIHLGGPPGPAFHLRRPLLATRLLALMERVATEVLGYAPALAISVEDIGPSVPIQTSTAPAAAPPRGQTGLTALVVDDSLPVRTQMKLALQDVASHVDFAETGEEAEDYIAGRRYDIVFLDVVLPGKDGYELCRLIKSHPEKKSTPVIMLTSNSSPADRIKGKLAGCDTYLIKPVRKATFQSVLHELVKPRAAVRASEPAANTRYDAAR